jgi:hypothetical protein
MDGLLDEWMTGFEFKENPKGLYSMQKTEKSFCEFSWSSSFSLSLSKAGFPARFLE